MKIALICPSNILYMPYVHKYEEFLKQSEISYDLINWDRFHIEDDSELTYKDSKIGHQRSMLDYLKFNKFAIDILSESTYDKVIVFGIQLSFFLRRFLISKYKLKYVLDIRDYNKMLKFINIKKIVNHSYFTAISSPGFIEWLPVSDKYVFSHNTKTSFLQEYYNKNLSEVSLNLSYIGSIRDANINIALISDLRNSNKINLEYHGDGIANSELDEFISENNIKNVKLTGRYSREREEVHYKQSDMINILINNTDINNQTLLSNRLYQAVIYGRPILANEGSYQANMIKEYNLGLVINKIENIEDKVIDYLSEFNIEEYNRGRRLFFEKVRIENKQFEDKLASFFNSN